MTPPVTPLLFQSEAKIKISSSDSDNGTYYREVVLTGSIKQVVAASHLIASRLEVSLYCIPLYVWSLYFVPKILEMRYKILYRIYFLAFRFSLQNSPPMKASKFEAIADCYYIICHFLITLGRLHLSYRTHAHTYNIGVSAHRIQS